MINKLDKNDLSDLQFDKLPSGFSVIFDNGKPVGVVSNYEYYQYISVLIGKVKEYIEHFSKENKDL